MLAQAQLSDAQVGAICFRLYADHPEKDPYWTYVWAFDGGFAAIKHLVLADGTLVDVVVWRGSVTAYDWLLNFDALPAQVPLIGDVHAGFWKGVDRIKDQIVARLRPGAMVVPTGHSRGGGQANQFAGWLAATHRPPARLVTFGTPRPGYQQLADVLAKAGVEIRQYRNMTDPVTDVPFAVDLIGTTCDLPYVHVAPFIELVVQPDDGDPWGPVAPHHWQLYTKGLGNTPPPAPVPWWQWLQRVLAVWCWRRKSRQPNAGPLSEGQLSEGR